MKSLTDCKGPNTGGWQDRHILAATAPRGFERPIRDMLLPWRAYAKLHRERYGSAIGDDYVLGPAWAQIGSGLLELLNGETGRLDCGTLDHWIRETAREHGVDSNAL